MSQSFRRGKRLASPLPSGAQAALRNTRIPLVEVGEVSNEDEEPELELDDDPAHAKHVDMRRVPIIVTASKVRKPMLETHFTARVPTTWQRRQGIKFS